MPVFSSENGLFNQGGLFSGSTDTPSLDGSLRDIISSCVCDQDANQADSMIDLSGSSFTTFANLVTQPADGANQTDYDFINAVGGSAFTYSGTLGTDGRLVNSGSDNMQQRNSISTTPSFAKAHRSDQPGGYSMLLGFQDTSPAGSDDYVGNALTVAQMGIRLRMGSDERMEFSQIDGSSNKLIGDLTPIIQSGTNYLMILAWDGSVMNSWVNGVHEVVDAPFVFNSVVVDATDPYNIGLSMDSGTNLWNHAFFMSALDGTDAANAKTFIETRSPIVFP